MQEKHEAELALQKKMEEEHKKHQQEKLLQKEEHRKEEEVRKKLKDEEKEWHNAEATAAADSASAQLVSPSNPKDIEMEDLNLNKNLFGFMNGEGEEESKEANHSPPKNKPKKSNKASYKQALAAKTVDKPGPVKHVVKSTLKAGFKDNHVHNFPRILVEASIELKGESLEQEFIVSLQELLKNGQMVDKNFAFCPVKQDDGKKKIQDQSGVPTNMTLLSAHFKILTNKGKNPFKKQKVWRNNKEVKGDLRNPIIYFSMEIATDKEPEDLLARISHGWHWRGGIMLKVKDLQSFESETILCLSKIFTATNKKTVWEELCEVLSKAQELAQDIKLTNFLWDAADLPRNSSA
jgi:hypothetical protein